MNTIKFAIIIHYSIDFDRDSEFVLLKILIILRIARVCETVLKINYLLANVLDVGGKLGGKF